MQAVVQDRYGAVDVLRHERIARPDTGDQEIPRWELTVAECATLTGRDERMIRWFIRNGVLKARLLPLGGPKNRPFYLIDGISLGNLVIRGRPKHGRKQPKFLQGAERERALAEPADDRQ